MPDQPDAELVLSADPGVDRALRAMGDVRTALDTIAHELRALNQARIVLRRDRQLIREAVDMLQSTVKLFLTSTTAEPVLVGDRMALIDDGLQKILDRIGPESDEDLFLPEVPGV